MALLLVPTAATAELQAAVVSAPTPPPVDLSDPAPAKPKGPVDVSAPPSIMGWDTAQVGATLTAQGGAWSGPHGTEADEYQWWRCATPSPDASCVIVGDATTRYVPVIADKSEYIFAVLYAWHGSHSDYAISLPSAPVAPPAAPAPVFEVTPQPVPVPVIGATPQPVPPQPAPVTNVGAGRKTSAEDPKILQPFPVVRLAGRLTLTGARVTLFSVRAPRRVRIAVACGGTGCPTRRWGRTTTGQLTRIGAFERSLPAGMRITVAVTRPGYIGKHTVFWIRRGKVPLRQDSCVYPNGKVGACPRA